MKQRLLPIMMAAVVMLALGINACSSDNDDYTAFSSDIDDIRNPILFFVGEWQMIGYHNGWGEIQEIKAGEITTEFSDKGMMTTTCRKEGIFPFVPGTLQYTVIEIERSIYTGRPARAIELTSPEWPKPSPFVYSFSFQGDSLFLSQEGYDAPGFTFIKKK